MEIWDAYDRSGNRLSRTLVRGEPIPDGVYYLGCEVLVCHADGSYLCMQRAASKPNYPGFYEATAGGAALAGEDPLACVRRELKEETGIDCDAFTEVNFYIDDRKHGLTRCYVCTVHWPKDKITLQPGETEAFRWMTRDEFCDFIRSNKAIDIQMKRFHPYFIAEGLLSPDSSLGG